ncbi:MAG: hypothetical protein IJI68_00605 [Eggerthellaceae bacterium]|nr:hypothetical protein [Eggerthellaceae bacterium]
MGEQQGDERRRMYSRLNRTTSYALECVANEDAEGERIALKHGLELMLDLLGKFYDEGGDGDDAVELDGMRDVPGEAQDLQEAGAKEEEGPRQAYVVLVVQGGDATSGEVLKTCLTCDHSNKEVHADDQLVCWLDPSCGRAVSTWTVCPRYDREVVNGKG